MQTVQKPKSAKRSSRSVGDVGENIAMNYLRKQGFEVVDQNWQIRGGELDIIGLDEQSLVFVEVKFRRNVRNGTANESLTPLKRKRIRRSAELYLMKKWINGSLFRFDFIAIDQLYDSYRLTHYRNLEFED